jgi:hypothetical protein
MAAMGEKKELKKNTSTTVFLNKKEKKKQPLFLYKASHPLQQKKNLHKTKPQLNIKPLYLCFHYERTKNILPNFSNSFE